MIEFVIMDSIENRHLMVVSENRYTANMALLRYLTDNGYQVCVLKDGFLQSHFIVVGEQNYFESWLKEEYDKADPCKKPVIEHVASLDAESVSAWANEILLKEVWTYHISHEFYDEFNRSGPTIRCYDIGLGHFAPVSPDTENDPAYKDFKDAGYIPASVTREEAV